MRLGIDVGRATTAAVLTDTAGRVVGRALADSAPTTAVSLRRALARLGPLPGTVRAVAVVCDLARRPLVPRRVAALRISPGCHPALGPFVGWPPEARAAVAGPYRTVDGGSSVTGRPLAALDRVATADFAHRARAAGVTAFAVCAAGAPTAHGPELEAAGIIADSVPDAALSLSYEIGSPGLRERENATVLNAALGGWAGELVQDCRRALRSAGIDAPLLFARDSGGLVSADYFRRHPVIATSPATPCAARGAAARTGSERAVVVDAGAGSVRCLTVVDGEPVRHERPYPGALGVRVQLRAPEVTEPAEGTADEIRAVVARLGERVPGAPVIRTGGGAEAFADTGAPESLFDAARHAARADCRAEIEHIVSAAGRAELDQLLDAARGHALSLAIAAGAAPATVRVRTLTHAPVAYLPAGVHRVTVQATGEPFTDVPS
ncbi:hydantoinase/oxoprolinase family protein [Streptomyces sp. NPDC001787]|uniref:hydantoinase/oxoprolinase family protein n=1 Tax=Streptomyces sp. NPDC001787 TaxID=3154523 RepID=UPI0033281371